MSTEDKLLDMPVAKIRQFGYRFENLDIFINRQQRRATLLKIFNPFLSYTHQKKTIFKETQNKIYVNGCFPMIYYKTSRYIWI